MGEYSFLFLGLIACELTPFSDAGERFRLYRPGLAGFSGTPCTFALRFPFVAEPFLAHTEPILFGIFVCQFIRESVCVIEAECIFTFDDRTVPSRFIAETFIYADAFVECDEEAFLLLLDDFFDEVAALAHVGVESTHDIRHGVGQLVQERTFDIEFLAEPYSAPDKPAEDITTPFV